MEKSWMRPLGRPVPAAAAAVLVFLLAINVHRARTQSITYDEAVTYETFVAGSFSRALTQYNANNHVLFSMLANLTTSVLGPSEFTLRLPTVAAGLVYFAATWSLCRFLFGEGLLFLAVLGALTANPFVLDYLSAGRGYGLALAFWTVALHQIVRVLVTTQAAAAWRWGFAGTALGLSVASNITFLFAAAALAISASGLGALTHLDRRRSRRALVVQHVGGYFVGLGLFLAAAILVVPLSHARREFFWFGTETLNDTVRSLVDLSLRHHRTLFPLDTEGAVFQTICGVIAGLWLPALGIAALVAGLLTGRRLRTESPAPSRSEAFLLLMTATMTATVFLLIAGHRIFEIPYPLERTGLYLIVLFVLLVGAVARVLETGTRASRAAARMLTIAIMLVVGQFAIQFNTDHYATFRYDAGSRRHFEQIARCGSPGQGSGPLLRIWAEPQLLGPSLSYYRTIRHATWMAPVEEVPDLKRFNYDLFLVKSEGYRHDVRALAMLVYTDPVSGVALFVNRSARASLISCFAASTANSGMPEVALIARACERREMGCSCLFALRGRPARPKGRI